MSRATMTALLSTILLAAPKAPAQAPTARRLDLHGDALPDNALVRLGTVRFRHGPASVEQVVYLDNGRRLATLAQDGSVRVWDAQTGQEIRAMDTVTITALAADPDGKRLATVAQDGSINVWDVVTGKPLNSWKDDAAQGSYQLLFSPDGKQLLSRTTDYTLQLWDVASGKRAHRFGDGENGTERFGLDPSPAVAVAFLEHGKYIATGTTEDRNQRLTCALRRWDVATGKEMPTVPGPAGDFHALAFTSDGKTAAWGCDDGTIRIWNLQTNKQLQEISATFISGNALAFSPDGSRLASRDHSPFVRLWDVASGKELRQLALSIPSDGGRSLFSTSNLCFAPDGKWLVSGTAAGTLRQWEADSGKERGPNVGHHGIVSTLAVFADGKTVATHGGEGTIRLWDAATGKAGNLMALPEDVTNVAFSADGRFVAIGEYDGVVHFREVATGKELRHWQANVGLLSAFTALALSADGKVLATRGADPAITLWDTSSGKELRLLRESVPGPDGVSPFLACIGRGTNLLFSPDGSLLAVRGAHRTQAEMRIRRRRIEAPRDTTLRFWDLKSGQPLLPLETGPVSITAFAFSPDSRTIAASTTDNRISLWEPATGKMRWSFGRSGGNGGLTALCFSPDGRMLVGVGPEFPDSSIRIWDPATGQQLPQSFPGHRGLIACLAFTSDGRRLISGGHDTTALVWDVAHLLPRMEAVEVTAERAEALWNELAAYDAMKAYEAIHVLSLSPQRSLALLKERLKPLPVVDEARIAQLVADLDSNVFAERHKATVELEKFGDAAEPCLTEALARQPPAELRQRIERLLEKLGLGQAPPVDVQRAQRALEVLERMGTPEARELLQTLAHGAAGARFTRSARAALERLGK